MLKIIRANSPKIDIGHIFIMFTFYMYSEKTLANVVWSQIIAPVYETWVAEFNGDVRILAWSSKMAVSTHAQ